MRYEATSVRDVRCDWSAAFAMIGDHLRALDSPHHAELACRPPSESGKEGADITEGFEHAESIFVIGQNTGSIRCA